MEKIISARVDESVAYLINTLARQLNISKKKLLEDAIREFAAKVNHETGTDVFTETCGCWVRDESPGIIVEGIRKQFRHSMKRYQK